MTPTLVHRYTWPIAEAIEALLGDAVGDCEAWRIRIEADEVVIDVVAPADVGRTIEVPDNFDVDKLCDMIVAGEFKMPVEGGELASNEAAKSDMATPEADAAPADPPRKGGALARQAGIICGEKGFWTFLTKRFGAAISSADEAANWLREDCAIKTRADLDYEPAAAGRFKEISRRYGLWLEGYDD